VYRDGTGCPFWYWENDYIKKIGENGTNDAPVGDELMMQGGESMKQSGDGCNCIALVNEARKLLGIGKELVSVLKGICMVGVCMLVVMVINLIVNVFK
jgi:hypothetical protein